MSSRRGDACLTSAPGSLTWRVTGQQCHAAAARKGVDMTVTADRAAARRSGARASGPGPARAAEQLSRADRAVAPLESHAEFAAGRSRDPVGLLLGQAGSRVPELVPVRHGRMLVSAF